MTNTMYNHPDVELLGQSVAAQLPESMRAMVIPFMKIVFCELENSGLRKKELLTMIACARTNTDNPIEYLKNSELFQVPLYVSQTWELIKHA